MATARTKVSVLPAATRSPHELASLVRHSAGKGTLAGYTARLVVRSLAFGTRRAGEVMTPRPAMVTVSDEATVAGFLARCRRPAAPPSGARRRCGR